MRSFYYVSDVIKTLIMTHYYIYKITLTKGKLKDHYYIGQHKSKSLKDNYKGSGRIVQDYYKKYPDGYTKEILCLCNDKDELNAAEDFYVGDKYETDTLCLNLKAGGNQPGFSEETRQKMSDTLSDGRMKGEKNGMYGKKQSDETRQKLSDALKGHTITNETRQKLSVKVKGEKNGMFGVHRYGDKNPMYGKKQSDETRQKQSDSIKGEKHPLAKQCIINGVAYGCLKDAYNYIKPNYTYRSFCGKYRNNKL